MVYGMLERHDALIDIESALGRGTTIRLTFPVAMAADTVAGRTHMASASSREE